MLPTVDATDIPGAVLDEHGRFLGAVSRHTAIGALAKPPQELRAEAAASAETSQNQQATACTSTARASRRLGPPAPARRASHGTGSPVTCFPIATLRLAAALSLRTRGGLAARADL